MIERCCYPSAPNYKRYGALGVTVCNEWKEFPVFLADMGERPEGKSLDRIDGAKGYCKENCRWATVTEQNRNQRQVKLSKSDADEIRSLVARGCFRPVVAKAFGVTTAMIGSIVRGESWK